MAVASLAAILKPQILCLMQGSEEEKCEAGGRKTIPNQLGLLDDTVDWKMAVKLSTKKVLAFLEGMHITGTCYLLMF